ncbi:MAG: GAF domain-containing sensor histidine kinase [Anaerolineae bacterium]|nr:GAF domain-containing sensor histidine kinase [Anaerolineae bacterium]
MASDNLTDQIEELVMMQRVDEELGATLDFENVLMLAMDWALRRTGASAGLYATYASDGQGLLPLIALGYPPGTITSSAGQTVVPNLFEDSERTRESHFIANIADRPDYRPIYPKAQSAIVVPIELRGAPLGVICLEGEQPHAFEEADLGFVKRLAGRAAIALDHARLYREAEAQADEMAALYAASNLISSSLERSVALANAAQSMAAVLQVSSVIIAEYKPNQGRLVIAHAYRLPTVRNTFETLPETGDGLDLGQYPSLQAIITSQRSVAVRASDPDISVSLRRWMAEHRFQAMLITPLVVPLTAQTTAAEVLGLVFSIEGRHERRFAFEEIQTAAALGSQIASALRQTILYEEVRELEMLKSEMIRMASHDLRNPLGGVMGYFELLVGSLGAEISERPDRQEYVRHVRNSLGTMRALIEDLLTLEKVDSERKVAWAELDFAQLTRDVFEAQRSGAELKGHSLTLQLDSASSAGPLHVFGSTVQLREAITNLIDNAIKYTPKGGSIQVRLNQKAKRLIFEVQDNGYGISKERQQRLFQRFFRAHEPGTDHISGTGLGLSLVKTVIDRHGGEVWVHSESGIGSTFGFWLPLAALPLETGETAK